MKGKEVGCDIGSRLAPLVGKVRQRHSDVPLPGRRASPPRTAVPKLRNTEVRRAHVTRIRWGSSVACPPVYRGSLGSSLLPTALALIWRSSGLRVPGPWDGPAFWAFATIGLTGLVDAYRSPRGALLISDLPSLEAGSSQLRRVHSSP
jgi:hypothetical protein